MRTFPGLSRDFKDATQWMRRATDVIHSILGGKLNAVFDITLAASATSTAFTNPTVTADSVLLLEPRTASALVARPTLRQSAASGAITLTHASAAAADQNFRGVLIG